MARHVFVEDLIGNAHLVFGNKVDHLQSTRGGILDLKLVGVLYLPKASDPHTFW